MIIIDQMIALIFHIMSTYFSFRNSMVDILALILFYSYAVSIGYLII